MNNHTPGPWKYYVQRTCDGYETHTIDTEAKVSPYEGNRVCSCGGMKEGDGYLIAAAPDLLEAAEKVVELELNEINGDVADDLAHDLARTQAVESLIHIVAKAKGEQG